MTEEDPAAAYFSDIQLVQNNLLRLLNGTKVKEMVSISSMLTKFNMRSVNQTNGEIKLLEIWKSLNVDEYPLQIELNSVRVNGKAARAAISGKPLEIGRLVSVMLCKSGNWLPGR